MKKRFGFFAFVSVVFALLIAGCAMEATVFYTEQDDANNGTTAETTTGNLLQDVISISGSFSSTTDHDYYRVAVPSGVSNIGYDVYDNGSKVTHLLGMSTYPFGYTQYDASDVNLLSSLLMAAVNEDTLESGCSYIEFHFGPQLLSDTPVANAEYELIVWGF